jgi:molecular chaperone HtpG
LTQSPEEFTSLDEYMQRIKQAQKAIDWLSGEGKDFVLNSPMLDYSRQGGSEVLVLTDPMYEYILQQLKDYSDHELLCITKENCELGETKDEKKAFQALNTTFEPATKQIKHIIGQYCEKAVVSKRHWMDSNFPVTHECPSTQRQFNPVFDATKENPGNQCETSNDLKDSEYF